MTIIRTFAALALVLGTTAALAQLSAWAQVKLPQGTVHGPIATGGADGVAIVRILEPGKNPVQDGLRTLRSTDGGLSWEPVVVSPDPVQSFHPSPSDSHVWFAVSNRALYRSSDGGATWTVRSRGQFEHPSGGLYYVEVGAEPDLLFAKRVFDPCSIDGTCRPYLRGEGMMSTDGGDTWRGANIDEVYEGLHPSPADAQVIYARRWVGINQLALFRSEDQGATWIDASPPLEGAVLQDRFVSARVVLDRHDSQLVYLLMDPVATGTAETWPLYVTRDGGRSWDRREAPVKWGALVADPLQSGRAWSFGRSGEVFETRDAGETWVAVEAAPRTATTAFWDAAAAVFRHGGNRVALRLLPGESWRLDLGPGALALGSDLWWNPAAPGTGLTITHHASRQTFVVWYDLDEAGHAAWRVMPGGTWNDRTLSGVLYETRGTAWFGSQFDPNAVDVRRIGVATIAFANESNATLSWTLDAGGAGEKSITRQLFGPVAVPNTPESLADLWWSEAEPGWGIAVNHQHNTVFAAWFVYDDAGDPQWVVMPDAQVTKTFLGIQVRPKAAGDVYAVRGGSAGGQHTVTKVGTATLTFPSADRAVLEYEVAGKAGRKDITRQPF